MKLTHFLIFGIVLGLILCNFLKFNNSFLIFLTCGITTFISFKIYQKVNQ